MKAENVYAVLFNNGVLKVGRSANPESRIKNHINNASRHMIDHSVFFISESVTNGIEVEAKLINYCAETHERNGSEYFLEADFAFARDAMLSLGLLVTWGDEFRKSSFKGSITISTTLGCEQCTKEDKDTEVLDLVRLAIAASKDGMTSRGIVMDRLRKKKMLSDKVTRYIDNLSEEQGIEVLKTKHKANGTTVIKYRLA